MTRHIESIAFRIGLVTGVVISIALHSPRFANFNLAGFSRSEKIDMDQSKNIQTISYIQNDKKPESQNE